MYIFNYRNEKGIRGGCTKEVGPYCNSPLAKQCDPFQQNLVSYLPLTQLNEFLQISAAAAPLEEHSLMAISIIAVDILYPVSSTELHCNQWQRIIIITIVNAI